jgi:hypothetical protein
MRCISGIVLFLAMAALRADEPPAFEATGNYAVRKVEGWTVLIHPVLAKEQPELLDKTLTLLGHQLYQVDRVVPREAVAKLRGVKIWIENFDKLHACMCYHPDPNWLRGKKANPDKAKCVEIANPTNFLKFTIHQPWMVFHELAHAYHHQALEKGYRNPEVEAAFHRAAQSKKNESVLHINGRMLKHYALNNPMEYFAEMSEAFFGTNDFFPFVRSELKQHDPEMFELLAKLWGVK